MLPHVQALLQTIHTLRAPGGCPWDRKQTLATAVHHLQDESAELLEAALEGDLEHVREELGDLLFMVCFVTEILSEQLDTDFDRVADVADTKLVRRHPHVFGEAAARDAGESQVRWNEIKAQEKRDKGLDPDAESVLKDLPASTPPSTRPIGIRRTPPRWASTGPAWTAFGTSSTRRSPRRVKRRPWAIRRPWSTRWAMYSSRWPISPDASTCTPTWRYGARTRVFARASTWWRRRTATTASACAMPRSTSWKPPGRRPSASSIDNRQ